MFRHSVFFRSIDDASKAEEYIKNFIEPEEIFQSNDGESGLIEVRFFTAEKLTRYEQNIAVRSYCETYALNCED